MAYDIDGTRGRVNKYVLAGQEYFSVFTESGKYRAGEVHPHKKYLVVLYGEIQMKLKDEGKDVDSTIKPNKIVTINENTPHMFYFPVDTVLLEWWDGEFVYEHYPEYRKMVEEGNENA